MATIQGVYVALFGRPADPTGLNYFNSVTNNGADLTAIGDLAATKEYQDRFAGQSNNQIITSIYQSLFDRNPEQAGLDFFVAALANGTFTINNIAIAILDGATGSDKTLVDKKIAAANKYTSALDTPDEVAAYSGNAAAAKGIAFIDAVTASSTEVDDAAADAAVADLPAQSTGDSFMLTTSPDSASANIFNAPVFVAPSTGTNVQTLNSTDMLSGTGNDDILTAILNNTEPAGVAPTLAGIETVSLSAIANSIFSAANATGITKIGITGSANADLTVNNLAELAAITVTGTDEDADLTVQFANSVVSGSSDAVSLTLNGVGAGTPASAGYTNDINVRGQTSGGIETLNVKTEGAASRVNSLGSDASVINAAITDDSVVSSIVLTGDQNLTIENELFGVSTFDASAFTGKANVTFNDDTGDKKDVTATGGTGDDTFDFQTALDKDDVVDGGDGTDTLGITAANGTTLGTDVGAIKVSNVEKLAILGNTAGNSTLDFDVFSTPGFTSISVEGADTLNRNVTLTDTQTSEYTLLNSDNVGGGANNLGTVTIDLKTQTGLADNISVNLITDDQSNNFGVTEVDAQGVELMTLDASTEDSDADDDIVLGTLDADNLTVLTVTGNADLTITNALDAAVKNVDGSASTGDLSIVAGVAEFNAKGGSGDDTFTSAGATFVDGTAGTSFTGNGGENTFNYVDADASITGANITTAAASTNGGISELLTITDIDFGSGSASGAVDKIDLSNLTVLGADLDSAITIVNGGATEALSGANLGAAVNSLVNAGTLLDGERNHSNWWPVHLW